MATYLIINIFFMVIVSSIVYAWIHTSTKVFALTLAILFVLTAIFDNVIVGVGIVHYDSAKILGLHIGVAPIEDFMYPLLAVIIIPSLWNLFGIDHDK